MTDFTAQVQYRNARFRAWRALGVPLTAESGWRLTEEGPAVLGLQCAYCGCYTRISALPHNNLTRLETTALQVCDDPDHYRTAHCSHLELLCDYPDPPELVDLTALELLADG